MEVHPARITSGFWKDPRLRALSECKANPVAFLFVGQLTTEVAEEHREMLDMKEYELQLSESIVGQISKDDGSGHEYYAVSVPSVVRSSFLWRVL